MTSISSDTLCTKDVENLIWKLLLVVMKVFNGVAVNSDYFIIQRIFFAIYFNTLDKAIIFAIDDIKHAQLRKGLRLLLAKIIHF